MAGTRKEPGPTAQRAAANLRRIRRDERHITTAGLSRRLSAIGYPIADTSITKAEHATRRIDADDLVPLALALGVTPNTLLMPEVGYLGTRDTHHLTPAVSGTAEELWQWAQGERALPLPVPDFPSLVNDDPALDFMVRSRPYLAAPRHPSANVAIPELRALSAAVQRALKAGASGTDIRRVTEMTMTLPAPMPDDDLDAWLEDNAAEG